MTPPHAGSLGSRLWGDPATTTLQNRVFNTVMLLVVLTGLVTSVQNLMAGHPAIQVGVSAAGAVAAALAYAYSRKTRRYRAMTVPVMIFFLLLLSLAWFGNGGSLGSVPYFFFILSAAVLVFFEARWRAVFLALTCVVIAGLFVYEYRNPTDLVGYDTRLQQMVDMAISLLLSLLVNGALVSMVFRHYLQERDEKDRLLREALADKERLEEALEEIRLLRGIIPICSSCKKIRDDEGYWSRLDSYLVRHSGTRFTHGICPACSRELYGDLADDDDDPAGEEAPNGAPVVGVRSADDP